MDVVEDRIKTIHTKKKMTNNYKNIPPFDTVYDIVVDKDVMKKKRKKKKKIITEGFASTPQATQATQDNGVNTLLPGEGKEKIEEMKVKEIALKKEYNRLVVGSPKPTKTQKHNIAIAKAAWMDAKKKLDEFGKSVDPAVGFFKSLDPPIKYVKGEKPKFLVLIYMSVVVLFNIPNILINFVSKLLTKILPDSNSGKEKSAKEEKNDYEIIRTFLVEICYLLASFYLTYVLLDYGFSAEPKMESIGKFTTFKWTKFPFLTEFLTFLWYPSELTIRILSTGIKAAFTKMRLDNYPSIKFLIAFCVSLFFIFNFLVKCRSAFFKCFIREDVMPKASWQVHLLLSVSYLSHYMGVYILNAVKWYMSPFMRFLAFLCHVIVTHLGASFAQFTMTLIALYYIGYKPFGSMRAGEIVTPIYEKISGKEKSCKSDGYTLLGKVNEFLGTYLLQKPGYCFKNDYSRFTAFTWMLFFMYRMQKIELTNDKTIRILTGVFNGLGIFICLGYMIINYIYEYRLWSMGRSTLELDKT